MKFNKLFLFTAITAAFSLGTSALAAPIEQKGTINFTGEIYAASCIISINNVNTTLNPNQSIDLGRHPSSAFLSDNAESKSTGAANNGNIVIKAEDCPTNQTLSLTIEGTPVSGSTQLLALTPGTEQAKNIAVVLYPESASAGNDLNKAIDITGSTPVYSVSTGNNSEKTITIYPVYRKISNNEVVTSGTANSSLNYSLVYN